MAIDRHEVANFRLGRQEDRLPLIETANKMTVPARSRPKIGGAHAGFAKEELDVVEQGCLHAPYNIGYSPRVKSGFIARCVFPGGALPQGMYATGWRTRLESEIERLGISKRAASQAAGMHDGWVSELTNPSKNKEPTISPFARMCIETGMRMGYILTGEGGSAEAERVAALFSTLDPAVYDAVFALLERMPKASPRP